MVLYGSIRAYSLDLRQRVMKAYDEGKWTVGQIHKSLRVTPAMEAGVADHVWSLEEVVALLT